jgi:hypothetical protein
LQDDDNESERAAGDDDAFSSWTITLMPGAVNNPERRFD